MFEKFSYCRRTSPFSTSSSKPKENTSPRKEGLKRNQRKLNLEEVVEAVTEKPLYSLSDYFDDSDSADDEDLLNSALTTDRDKQQGGKGLDKAHLDSEICSNESNIKEKSCTTGIHNGSYVKDDTDTDSPRTLRLKLKNIFPNEKEDIIKRAVKTTYNLQEAKKKLLALKATKDFTDNIDSPINKKKAKKKRKRVLSFNDSDSDMCQTPNKKHKYTSTAKCPNIVNKPELPVQSKNIKDEKVVIEISDHEEDGKDNDNDEDADSVASGSDDDDGFRNNQENVILSFLNESSKEELNSIPGFSISKSKKLIQLRPFESWKHLKSTLESAKGFSVQILWDCHLLLEKRLHVIELMEKCERISKKIQTMHFDQTNAIGKSVSQPGIINKSCKLKPYQLTGLNWLVLMHKLNMNCILADEMGLGKTIQAITFIAHLIEKGEAGPYLIVAPASTIDNWQREMSHWCPTVNFLCYYGSSEERGFLRQELLSEDSDCQVIITTYQMVASNPQDRSLFRKLNTHYVIFDEGHMLKNMKTQRYQKLFNLRTKHRILLTGTPLQNNLLELMSLLSFVMPCMFGGSSDSLKMLFSDKRNEESSVTYEKERLEQAKRIMKPFVLRRLKQDVLHQLPQKHEKIITCDMSEQQRLLYEKVFLECYQEYKHSGTLNQSGKNKNIIVPLRMASNHPLLLRNHYNDEKLFEMAKQYCRDIAHRDCDADLVYEDMTVMSDFELNRFCMEEYKLKPYALDQDVILESGKFHILDSLLPTMKEQGDRVLLFSQFTLIMDVIEVYLDRRNYSFLRLDGSTKVEERQSLVDRFNSTPDIFIFLLSTRAGGLGINLTSANVVILNDIDFNPYNDKQAEDRCHRVGQTRDVHVYKLISKNTIEQAMLKCAQSKLKLEKDVVSADDNEKDVAFILGQTFVNAQNFS